MLPLNKKKLSKIHTEFQYKLNFDGCSKGNPGISGAGIVIYNDEVVLFQDDFYIGENITNNYAEYVGLIKGLQKAKELKIKNILVEGDSQLVINHMKGIYKCNSENLMKLYNKAKELESYFDTILYNHIDRKYNSKADELANNAIKNKFNLSFPLLNL